MIKKTIYESNKGNQFNNPWDAILDEGNYVCPECYGYGEVSEEYDAYPIGLPDSGWSTDMKTRKVKCKLCDGKGYTVDEYIPRYVQNGWMKKK